MYVAGGSTGNSLETTVVQLAADALGVDIEDVNTIQGDTAVTPFGAGTGGSRSGSMTAGAVGQVAATLRDEARRDRRPHARGAPRSTSSSRGSGASVRGTPSMGVTVAEMANMAYFNPGALPEGMEPGLEASGRYKAQSPIVLANATHVCTCEVDPVTGQVEILRYIVSEDCGKMINPNVVEGQIAGGTVQGIGGALLEQLDWDEDGNPLVTTFVDYLLPTTTEVPDDRVRPRRDPGGRARRLQGRGRGRCHRRPAGGGQRRGRRARPARREGHPPAAEPGGDRRHDRGADRRPLTRPGFSWKSPRPGAPRR